MNTRPLFEGTSLNETLINSVRDERPEACWRFLCREVLRPDVPFEWHQRLHQWAFHHQPRQPVWYPSEETRQHSNIQALMRSVGQPDWPSLQRWASEHRLEYWEWMTRYFGVIFQTPYQKIGDETSPQAPKWWFGSTLNLVETALKGPSEGCALISADEDGNRISYTYAELQQHVFSYAVALKQWGVQPQDAVALLMPMHASSVIAYLALVAIGAQVVAIAESFSAEEIRHRLTLSHTRWVITQRTLNRLGKALPLLSKLDEQGDIAIALLEHHVLSDAKGSVYLLNKPVSEFKYEAMAPDAVINILFSSGTTATPKLIPWTQTTPLKSAADAFIHLDVHPGDRMAWPTSLGWMMGPWLLWSALLNRATVVLFDGAPHSTAFLEYLVSERVTHLGAVPSLFKLWRQQKSLEHKNWSCMRVLASTGECSQEEDMHYVMAQMGYIPMIEYCGGTEIGGAYITSSVYEPNIPGLLQGPALGLDFVLLDESHGGLSHEVGEVALIPPSMGLSSFLIGRDHHEVYYSGMPSFPGYSLLRRHGDRIRQWSVGVFQMEGRVDDAMNLGGIKVSAVEIEHCLNQHDGVSETAAIAVNPPNGGPSELIVFVVPDGSRRSEEEYRAALQQQLNRYLNPLFKIQRVVLRDALPRTASQKIMRRLLRDELTPVTIQKN